MCMSQYGTAALKDVTADSANAAGSMVAQILTDIRSMQCSTYFEPYIHGIDAGLSWLYGMVTGAMDMVQVIDWHDCKLPVTSTQSRGSCVCSDNILTIPTDRRTAKPGSGTDCVCATVKFRRNFHRQSS